MIVEKKVLENMTRDQLLELVLEQFNEGDHRETEVAGTEEALKVEGEQADYWAGIARTLDKVVIFYQARFVLGMAHDAALEHAELTEEELGAAVDALDQREAARQAEIRRRADRAAAKKAK